MFARTLTAVVALALSTSVSYAGWMSIDKVEFADPTEQTLNCPLPSVEYRNTNHAYQWSITGDTASIIMSDRATDTNADWHKYYETINDDPYKTFTAYIDNDSVYTWTGYTMTVQSNTPTVVVKFVAPVTSAAPTWQTVSFTDSQANFSGPSALHPDDTAVLTYRLQITPPKGYVGQISYTVTMVPTFVPEPASLALVALGAFALLRRR